MKRPTDLCLLWDRLNMGLKIKSPTISFRQAKRMVLAHLANLEARLQDKWLYRDQPTLVDFAVYLGLWFVRDLGECDFMDDYPNTLEWMDRIKAFCHGTSETISAENAIVVARQSEPRPIDASARQDALIGKLVSIVPVYYGQVPTQGELVGSLLQRWIIVRDIAETGRVHVRFTKQG